MFVKSVDWQNDHIGRGDVWHSRQQQEQDPNQSRVPFLTSSDSSSAREQLGDETMISDNNIIRGSTLFTSGRLKGGATMSAEEITNAFGIMSAHP